MGGIQKEGAYVPDPLHTRPSCTWVNMPNLIDVGQTVRAYVWRRSAGKLIALRLSKSLKIIRTDTERTYDFLLTFRSNNGPISHRLEDVAKFWSEICKFFCTHVYLTPQCGVTALRLNNYMMGLRGREKFFNDILSCFDTILECDKHRLTAGSVAQ